MTQYERGFISKCAEDGIGQDMASGLAKTAFLHWTHHLVPWETPVEVRRKARRAILAAENGHSGVARKIMASRYKDPKMEQIVEFIKDTVKRQKKTQDMVDSIKMTGVWPKEVKGNPFK